MVRMAGQAERVGCARTGRARSHAARVAVAGHARCMGGTEDIHAVVVVRCGSIQRTRIDRSGGACCHSAGTMAGEACVVACERCGNRSVAVHARGNCRNAACFTMTLGAGSVVVIVIRP